MSQIHGDCYSKLLRMVGQENGSHSRYKTICNDRTIEMTPFGLRRFSSSHEFCTFEFESPFGIFPIDAIELQGYALFASKSIKVDEPWCNADMSPHGVFVGRSIGEHLRRAFGDSSPKGKPGPNLGDLTSMNQKGVTAVQSPPGSPWQAKI